MLGHAGPYLGPADHDASSYMNGPHRYQCTRLSESSLSQAEVTSINSIIKYGGHVAYLRSFVCETGLSFCDVSFDNSKIICKDRRRVNGSCGSNSPSLYQHAIGRAVSTLLDQYETKLLEVEKQLRLDRCLGIEYIRATALPVAAWIPHVSDFIFALQCNKGEGHQRDQQSQSLSSCAIIDEIARRMDCCTDGEGFKSLEALLDATNAVLYNQCMRWIRLGEISDPADEFFIVRSVTDQDEQYEVRGDRIPYSLVSFALAGRMLFVGRAARILRQNGGAKDGMPAASHEPALEQNQHTSARTGSLKLHLKRFVSLAYEVVSSRLCHMLRNKFHILKHTDNIYKVFLHGDGLFYSELLRECDGKNMWKMIAQYGTGSNVAKEEWNILGGRSVFQHHVVAPVLARLDGVDSTPDSLEKSFTQWYDVSTFSIDVRKNARVNAAGRAMEADLFELSQDEVSHLSHTDELRIALSDAHDQVSSALSWLDGEQSSLAGEEVENWENNIFAVTSVILSCQYNLPRPVRVVMTDASMHSYNAFFRRLFSVHRASYELQKSWRLLLLPEYRDIRPGMAALYSLRAAMEFFVSNLLAYLKQDVAAVSFHALQDIFSSTNDYEELMEAHGRFLGTLRKGFFLDDPSFNVSLSKILALIHRFAALVQNMRNVVDIRAADITRLQDLFNLETKNMFDLLRASADSVGLCLRLDFNEHFANDSARNCR